jgi:hypothetical protein
MEELAIVIVVLARVIIVLPGIAVGIVTPLGSPVMLVGSPI